ncbi:MAG: hypothetical protein FJ125_14305 [Deltaproteobacteria bacterium]|nr:hypothetical protein [Deltaproteobacteria bacterium]
MRHLDHATLLAEQLVRTLSVRCTPAGRRVLGESLRYVASVMLGHPIGYLPPKERPFTPLEQQAHDEICDWCGNIPCLPWPADRLIPAEQIVPKIAEILGLMTEGDALAPVPRDGALAPIPAPTGVQEMVRNAFEGHEIVTFSFKGKPCVLASQIGEALGYADDGLTTVVTRNWAEDAIEGKDWVKIANGELRELKTLFQVPDEKSGSTTEVTRENRGTSPADSPGSSPISPFARHVIALTESGFGMVCIKTEKPLGRKLRREWADKIFPQLVKTGAYAPSASPSAQPQPPLARPVQQPLAFEPCSPPERSYHRQEPAAQPALSAEFLERRYQAGFVQRTANRLYKDGAITREEWRTQLGRAVEIATGGKGTAGGE